MCSHTHNLPLIKSYCSSLQKIAPALFNHSWVVDLKVDFKMENEMADDGAATQTNALRFNLNVCGEVAKQKILQDERSASFLQAQF
ncbi:hypothetical protein Tco_0921620 [Tanacetum coccineum]